MCVFFKFSFNYFGCCCQCSHLGGPFNGENLRRKKKTNPFHLIDYLIKLPPVICLSISNFERNRHVHYVFFPLEPNNFLLLDFLVNKRKTNKPNTVLRITLCIERDKIACGRKYRRDPNGNFSSSLFLLCLNLINWIY